MINSKKDVNLSVKALIGVMRNSIYIHGARVIDPINYTDGIYDIYLEEGYFSNVPSTLPPDTEVIGDEDLLVVPAFCDLHVHFRQPGYEEAETIASGCRVALAGGFNTVVTMPNTNPPIDSPELMAWEISEAKRQGLGVELHPSACISRGRMGSSLSDMKALREAGAVFFTDDGATLDNPDLMQEAMETAAGLRVPIVDHAQRRVGGDKGVMHAGTRSRDLGLPGISAEAETEVVARDIELAEKTGCALHIQHVSAAGSVDMIKAGKARGVQVTAEATPHHLTLSDQDVDGTDANFKMNPPLRSPSDRQALRKGIREGILDCFATDHAPHSALSKQRDFLDAPFGVIGLETAIGVTYTEMVATGQMSALEWVRRWTEAPMNIIGKDLNPMEPGHPAAITILDTGIKERITPANFHSKSRNTCFKGYELACKPIKTILY